MPVGVGIGTAVIGAGAGIIGASKQSKAAKQAAQMTQQDNAANRAFLTDIYNRNVGYLSPWMQTGQTANNAYMELLGFPAAQPQQPAFANYGGIPGQQQPSAFAQYPFANDGVSGLVGDGGHINPRLLARYGDQAQPLYSLSGLIQPPTSSPPINGGAQPSARSAFDNYRNSTGYDFRFGEGIRALQSAFSRNLESGAATKAAMRYGQGIASDEFSRYMDLLRGQSQQGLGGASALAGVGQNFGNSVVAGNQSAATAAANARMYMGNVAANNWANIGSSFGNALGFLMK